MGLDQQILDLVQRRTRLLSRAASKRRSKKLPVAEAAQEKRLWSVWEQFCRSGGSVKPRNARQLFVMLNTIGYEVADSQGRVENAFFLTPRPGNLDVDAPGPVSPTQAAMQAVLATATGSSARMDNCLLSDSLIDLAKALNTIGGAVSWEGGSLVLGEPRELAFEGKLIYAGESIEAIYYCIALALAHPGSCRLSGAGRLKLLDLRGQNKLLNMLGARLAPLGTSNIGLPARLECGGPMAEEVFFDETTEPVLAGALTLAAWSYEKGLTVRFEDGSAVARAVLDAANVLQAAGLEVVIESGRVRVPSGAPRIAEDLRLSLDPLLTTHILSMSALRKGRVRLAGQYDAKHPVFRAGLNMLETCGVKLRKESGAIGTEHGRTSASVVLTPGYADLAPLAGALACALPQGATIDLAGVDSGDAEAVLVSMFHCLGKPFVAEENQLRVEPGFEGEERPGAWLAPDALSGLSLALASMVRPGAALENPGVLGEQWPGFWNFYNRLPHVTGKLVQQKEAPKDDAKKRRRIRVR
jgi:5-enolpyruvylshikimate-3-phosphate synthase/chorismate mutase